MPQSPTSSSPRPRARRAIRLERSPFEPAVMLRGAVVGLVLAGLFLAVGFPLTAASPLDADLHGLARVNITDVDWLVATARLVSQTGHLALVVAVAVLVALWARWRWRTWDLGLLLFVVLSGSQAVTAVVKLLTSRERPDDALVSTLSSAFPSGHAVRGAAVYGLVAWLVLLVVRRRAVRLAVAGLAVLAILDRRGRRRRRRHRLAGRLAPAGASAARASAGVGGVHGRPRGGPGRDPRDGAGRQQRRRRPLRLIRRPSVPRRGRASADVRGVRVSRRRLLLEEEDRLGVTGEARGPPTGLPSRARRRRGR
jgi:hypothetical protein